MMTKNRPTLQEEKLRNAFHQMSAADQGKLLRLMQRLAKKPKSIPLTVEMVQTMFDNDCDIPLH